MNKIKKYYNLYKAYLQYRKELKVSKHSKIRFFNFKQNGLITSMFFYLFIEYRELLKGYRYIKIDFFAVYGQRYVLNWTNGDIKIFFSTENVKYKYNSIYADHTLTSKNIDLALGYEYLSDSKYFRFPQWIFSSFFYFFTAELDANSIIKKCKELSKPFIENRFKFASLISCLNNGWSNSLIIRKEICEALTCISKVDCAGTFMHNDDSLWQQYGDNKIEYLKNYKFNICPENSNLNGYVTEKLFQAIAAGCIPIYWGSDNNPEPEILNHDAILFWNPNGNNDSVLTTIEELNKSPKLLKEFMMQPRLKEHAAEKIISLYDGLESRLKELIEKKGKKMKSSLY